MLTVTFGGESAALAVILPVRAGRIPQAYAAAAAAAQFTGVEEETCEILGGAHSIILAALGDDPEATGAAAVAHLRAQTRVALDAASLDPQTTASLIAGCALRAWRAPYYLTKPGDDQVKLAYLDVIGADAQSESAWRALEGQIEASLFARDLVTEPSNILTPTTFANRLAAFAGEGISVSILNGPDIAQWGGLCAVGRGSICPPCAVILSWGEAPCKIALIGKGITFDTGGICIKPADGMWDMRADMAGAAACAGAMRALARTGASISVLAVLPLAENTTGGNSYRPGDVLRQYDGTTVCVTDTDAEGRLVLADAMGYARAQGAEMLITIATLTGTL